MRLKAEGNDHHEISKTLGMSLEDVQYWQRVDRPSREVYDPDLSSRPELAYLVGAYLGDGRTAGEYDKKVRFNLADLDFAKQLNELLAQVIGRPPKQIPKVRGFYSVDYDCAILYDYLQQDFAGFDQLTRFFPGMFLRGFFDAEGYASPILDHSSQRLSGALIGVANTKSEYLACVKKLLESFGINPKYHKTHAAGEPMTIRGKTYVRKHEVNHLVVSDFSEIQTFQEQIGFSIPDKKNKLSDVIWLLGSKESDEGYSWFISNYELRNRRWIKRLVGNETVV